MAGTVTVFGTVTGINDITTTTRRTETHDARVCAGVVLYRPDKALLARQAEGLRGRTLFVFTNEPIDTESVTALAPTDLRLICSEENVGLGHGLNIITEAAAREGFSHIMLLDQDSEPSPNLLDCLLTRALSLEEQGERVAILAPRLVPAAEGFYKPIRYEWRGSIRSDGLFALDFAPTSGSLVSLAAYAAVGPFRNDFFIAGIDVEWGFRAWDRHWGSYLATDLAMPHRWGESVNENEMGKPQILRHAPLRNYYYTRNVVATAQLPHVPLRWRIKSFAVLAAQIGLLALKGPPGSLKPVHAGLVDGFRNRLGPAPTSFA